MDRNDFDVIIVGSGAGGGTLAGHLAPSGKRILILERGGWLPRELENWDAGEVFVDNRYVSKETWYDERGKAFQPGIHYYVGGQTKFYGAALYRLRREDFGVPMAIFSYDEPSTGGSIVRSSTLEPSATGSLVYLNARPTVDATLERVKRAGGKVEGPAVQLPNDIGWIGFFTDTEGNRVGLHSKTNG